MDILNRSSFCFFASSLMELCSASCYLLFFFSWFTSSSCLLVFFFEDVCIYLTVLLFFFSSFFFFTMRLTVLRSNVRIAFESVDDHKAALQLFTKGQSRAKKKKEREKRERRRSCVGYALRCVHLHRFSSAPAQSSSPPPEGFRAAASAFSCCHTRSRYGARRGAS